MEDNDGSCVTAIGDSDGSCGDAVGKANEGEYVGAFVSSFNAGQNSGVAPST